VKSVVKFLFPFIPRLQQHVKDTGKAVLDGVVLGGFALVVRQGRIGAAVCRG
jgi:hypothetical protein